MNMTNAVVLDAGGLTRAFLLARPGLIGAGCPIGMLYRGGQKSPAGVTLTFSVGLGRTDVEGAGMVVPTSFEVRAPGVEEAALDQAERGARALAQVLVGTFGAPVLVTHRDGSTARLAYCGAVQGPASMGVPGGRALFRVTADFCWM